MIYWIQTVYCQNEKRATFFCKVGVPTTAKQHSFVLQQLQQLVCVGVGFGCAARVAAADLQRVLPSCIPNIQSSKRVGGNEFKAAHT
jgi:hypothetical protein